MTFLAQLLWCRAQEHTHVYSRVSVQCRELGRSQSSRWLWVPLFFGVCVCVCGRKSVKSMAPEVSFRRRSPVVWALGIEWWSGLAMPSLSQSLDLKEQAQIAPCVSPLLHLSMTLLSIYLEDFLWHWMRTSAVTSPAGVLLELPPCQTAVGRNRQQVSIGKRVKQPSLRLFLKPVQCLIHKLLCLRVPRRADLIPSVDSLA